VGLTSDSGRIGSMSVISKSIVLAGLRGLSQVWIGAGWFNLMTAGHF